MPYSISGNDQPVEPVVKTPKSAPAPAEAPAEEAE